MLKIETLEKGLVPFGMTQISVGTYLVSTMAEAEDQTLLL